MVYDAIAKCCSLTPTKAKKYILRLFRAVLAAARVGLANQSERKIEPIASRGTEKTKKKNSKENEIFF